MATFKMYNAKQRPPKTGWFKPRSAKNPFGVSSSSGGNCVWYAYGRFCQAAGKKVPMVNYGNAYEFYNGFSSKVVKKSKTTPQIGSIVVWGKTSSSPYGHVAFVEKVSDTHIWISEDGYFHGWMCGMKPPYHLLKMKRSQVNGRYGMPLLGYILNPTKFDNVEELDPSELDWGDSENGETASGSVEFSLQKGIERLWSSDNYKWVVEKAKETATERINKALASNVKSIAESYKEKPGNDETFGAKLVELFLEKVELPTIKERVLTKGNLASYPNLVEAPYIEINLNGIMIGGYGGDEDKYPNHVASMEISKINGRINQYRINLIHQVRAGEDPNFIDSLLSRTGIRNKVKIMYGDSAYGAFFKEDEAYITNVTYSESVQSSAIAYTIEAVSSVGLMQQAYFNFPAVSAKPSSEIIKMLYENKGTSTQLLSLLGGMKDKQDTLGSGLIPTDDDEIMIPGGQDMSLQERLMQLVSYMHDSTSPTSNYFLSFEDDGESGSFFKITKVNKTNATTDTILKNCYYVDVGYPGNAYVTGFTLDNDVYWPIFYKYSDSISSYNYDIDYEGNLIATKVNPLTISNKYQAPDVSKMNWWDFVTNYPVSATLTIKGLMKPVSLMENIYVYAQFYGKQDLSTGLYSIIGQHDSIGPNGYTTTLQLLRVQN